MNQAQWIWEYLSLREKEKEQNKLAAETILDTLKALKTILVSILGLNLVPGEKDADGKEKELIIPLSLITGRRDAVEFIFKKMNEEEQVNKALGDEEFEKISAAIARGEDLGDMEPLINMSSEEEKQLTEWFNPGRLRQLRSMGINIINGPHKQVTHVDLDKEQLKERINQQNKERVALSKELEKEFQQDKQELVRKTTLVTFDDEND